MSSSSHREEFYKLVLNLFISNCLQIYFGFTKFVQLGVVCIAIEVYSIVGLYIYNMYEIAECKVEDNCIVMFLAGARKCFDCIRCIIESD